MRRLFSTHRREYQVIEDRESRIVQARARKFHRDIVRANLCSCPLPISITASPVAALLRLCSLYLFHPKLYVHCHAAIRGRGVKSTKELRKMHHSITSAQLHCSAVALRMSTPVSGASATSTPSQRQHLLSPVTQAFQKQNIASRQPNQR